MVMCILRHFTCTIQRYSPATDIEDSSNTGEQIRECEPRVGRAGCGSRTCRACFSYHVPCVAVSLKTLPGVTAFMAAAWPTLNRCCSRPKARTMSRGPLLRGVATFLPYFICRGSLFFLVCSTSDSPGKCSRLIKQSSSASCRATRHAPISRQREMLAPRGKKAKKEKQKVTRQSQRGAWSHR